jgi:hypothetical protein
MILLIIASVHPVLKASPWHISVLFELDHRFLPNGPSVHPTLLSSLLLLCNSSDATTKWTVGSSNGANPIWPSAQCTKYIDACFYGTVGSSDGGFSSSFLSFFEP